MFILVLVLCSIEAFVTCSEKRGAALTPKLFLCDDFKILNVSWWYDWQMNFYYYHHFTSCTDMDSHKFNHIPMVWGHTQPVAVPSASWAILGFNEPHFHSQANLTPAQAVTHWAEVERHSHCRPLVSPAMATCHTTSKCYGDVFEWFDEFFRLCSHCRIDYLATHAYHCHIDTTMVYPHKLYDKYRKENWLAEFACPDHHNKHQQMSYMQ